MKRNQVRQVQRFCVFKVERGVWGAGIGQGRRESNIVSEGVMSL